MNWDLFIVLFYLAISLLVGFYKGRNVKSMRDYSVADCKFSTPVLVATISATWIGGESVMGISEMVFKVGIVYVFLDFASAFSKLLTAQFIAPHMAKFNGCISVGDMMERMYGKPGKIIAGICGSILELGFVGAQAAVMGHLFNEFLGIDQTLGILLGCGVFIIYSA